MVFEPTTSCIRWSSGKTLAADAGNHGFESSNHTEGKICFSYFTIYVFRVECEELFCKTNIKLQKVLKLIKKNCFEQKFDDIKLKKI